MLHTMTTKNIPLTISLPIVQPLPMSSRLEDLNLSLSQDVGLKRFRHTGRRGGFGEAWKRSHPPKEDFHRSQASRRRPKAMTGPTAGPSPAKEKCHQKGRSSG